MDGENQMNKIVHGDKIQLGNIDGSIVAIGQGAQVIIQQVQSSVEATRQQAQEDKLALIQSVERYTLALVNRAKGIPRVQLPSQDARQPYKSLYAYTLSDVGRFYGREKATEELLRAVGQDALTVLHGDSGVGKTSILQAGLSSHLLANSHLPIFVTVRQRSINEEVKRALLPDLYLTPTLSAMSLRGFMHELQGIVGPNTIIVLILDQFEAIFSTTFSELIRQSDFEELRACIADPTLSIRIVISIRDDLFGKLTSFESDIVKPYENHCLLSPLTLEEARDVAVCSAAYAEITYESGLVTTILADFATEEITPSQLQIVFSTLAEQLPPDCSQITYEQYGEAGRVDGILTNYLRAIKSQLTREDQQIAQIVLESLVGSDHRRTTKTLSSLHQDIEGVGLETKRLDIVLDFLLKKRIISPVQIGDLADTYAFEIVHDYIAEQIEVSPETQAKKVVQDLLARRSIDYGQFRSLLTPEELQLVLHQLPRIKLGTEEQSLVDKSKAEVLKGRIRRYAIIAISVLIPVLILLVFLRAEIRVAQQRINYASTAVAIQQTADSEVAAATQSLGMLAIAQETQQAKLTTAEARSIFAQATQVSAEREALLSAIVATRLSRAQTFDIESNPVDALLYDAKLWLAHDTGIVSVIDISTGNLVGTISVPGQPNALIYASGYIWISSNTHIVIVDPATFSILDSFTIPGRAGDVAYDGVYIWVSNENGLSQLDPESSLLVDRISLPTGTNKLEFDWRYIWASSYQATSLFVIDPKSGEVVEDLFLSEPIFDMLADGNTVWVTTNRSGLLRGFSSETFQLSKQYMVGTSLAGLTHDGATLWIADYADNAVLNLDATSGDLIGRYRVGRNPTVLTFDRHRVWSLNYTDRTATAIPLQIPVPISPAQIAYDNGTLWIIDQSSQKLIGISEATGEVISNYTLSDTPRDLVIYNHNIWLTLPSLQQIVAISPLNGDTIRTISVDEDVKAFLLTETMLWTASGELSRIVGTDLISGETAAVYPIPGEPVFLVKLGSMLWTATQDNHQLIGIDLKDSTLSSYALTGLPLSIAPDEARNLIWVGTAGTNLVQAIDPVTVLAVAAVEMSDEPRSLLVDHEFVWVAGGDKLSQIDPEREERLCDYQVGRGTFGMTFGQERIWVSSFTDRTIEPVLLEQ
jgi:glutamine cyclotransferase